MWTPQAIDSVGICVMANPAKSLTHWIKAGAIIYSLYLYGFIQIKNLKLCMFPIVC